ncbi:DUF6798 domain-containing protein [Tautonia marina]|uniref:DUF6798 domain-containing protein n=1 Tax=Tautonia marina TaxID=2653855 RepID=UPI0012605539|nr:DUF6798 domain-containing protein [Tautonia marina]
MRDGSPELDQPRTAPTWMAYALLFGLSLTLGGYRSLDGDQAYRLPLLLHQQDPAVFADDPFIRAFDAFNPHRGYLTLLDGPSRLIGLPAALFLLYAMTYGVTCLGVRSLARSIWPKSGEWVGVLAVALLLLADAGNIGTNHLFEPMLLDRLIAFGLGWVALALFVRGFERCSISPSPDLRAPPRSIWGRGMGVLAIAGLIGLAGLVHPALGMQLGMLLAAGWLLGLIVPGRLAMDRRSAALGLVALAVALLPTALMQAPQKAALFEGLDPETFRVLSFTVQGPQHMLPHLWRPMQWLAWFAYVSLAGVTLCDLGRPWSVARSRCVALLGILLAALALAWVAIEVLGDPRVTIFQPFRMATVVRGLCLVVIADRIRSLAIRGDFGGILRAALLVSGLGSDGAMVVAVATELTWTLGDRLRLPRIAASCGLAVLAGGIAYLFRHDPEAGYVPLLLGLGGAMLVGAWRFRIRHVPAWTPGRAIRLTCISFAVPVLAALAAIAPADGPAWLQTTREALISRCRFAESPTDDVERLALWARSHTPPDARFIGPPGPKTFRLWSRREVAFNRAASPYDGHGLADWAARFADHVGFEGDVASFARAYLTDRHALERRYQEMPDADRAALARRQGADYVLAAAPGDQAESDDDSPLELLRIDGRYAIYRLRETPAHDSPLRLADRRSAKPDRAQRRKDAEERTLPIP